MVSILRIQSIILVVALLVIGIMQAISATKLTDSSQEDTRQQVQRNAIISLSAAGILIFLSAFVIYRNKGVPSFLDQLIIVIASLVLSYVGINSADVAVDLQCDKDKNAETNQAWYFSTVSAMIGLVAVFLVILIKLFLKRSDIKRKLCKNCPPCPGVSKDVAKGADDFLEQLRKQGLIKAATKVAKRPGVRAAAAEVAEGSVLL
jgi:cell division protein FtsW (lipid II flippase)